MNDEASEQGAPRPEGRLHPAEGEPGGIHELLVDQDYGEALERLEEFEPEEGADRDWAGYLRGLGLLGVRELDDAYESFRSTAERITATARAELEADRYRIAAKCLKKMGWYHRRGDGHARAYAYHSMEYELVGEHGSAMEEHDAALSLDVVAYQLRMPQISRGWIERSIDAAAEIDGEAERHKALGISWNNLAGTLCDLGEFERAAEAGNESLDQWRAYEQLEGREENRIVWANHIFGDVYKRWGDHLLGEGDDGEARKKLEVARTALEEAVEEAEEREMSEADREDIRGKLEATEESLESVGGASAESSGEAGEEESEGGEGAAEEERPERGVEESDEGDSGAKTDGDD